MISDPGAWPWEKARDSGAGKANEIFCMSEAFLSLEKVPREWIPGGTLTTSVSPPKSARRPSSLAGELPRKLNWSSNLQYKPP